MEDIAFFLVSYKLNANCNYFAGTAKRGDFLRMDPLSKFYE